MNQAKHSGKKERAGNWSRVAIGWAFVVLGACQASPVPPQVESPPSSSGLVPAEEEPEQVEAASPPTWTWGEPLQLEWVRWTQEEPRVHFSQEQWAQEKLRVLPAQGPVQVSLNQQRPRPVRPGGLFYLRLTNEDEEVAPGVHRLVLTQEQEERLLIQAYQIAVEVESKPGPVTGCLLLTPGGTYNGEEAAEELFVLALPLEERLTRAHLSVVGPQIQLQGLIPWNTRVRGLQLPSGDFVFRLRCEDAEGQLVEEVERIITINRDAPQAPEQPG